MGLSPKDFNMTETQAQDTLWFPHLGEPSPIYLC